MARNDNSDNSDAGLSGESEGEERASADSGRNGDGMAGGEIFGWASAMGIKES
jgi:hypothetical protein